MADHRQGDQVKATRRLSLTESYSGLEVSIPVGSSLKIHSVDSYGRLTLRPIGNSAMNFQRVSALGNIRNNSAEHRERQALQARLEEQHRVESANVQIGDLYATNDRYVWHSTDEGGTHTIPKNTILKVIGSSGRYWRVRPLEAAHRAYTYRVNIPWDSIRKIS